MKELNEFIEMINNAEFAEAHEVLEDKWREWKKDPELRQESYILKGLINGTTALALKKLNRHEPSMQVWDTFLKYSKLIKTIPSVHTKQYQECENLLHVKYKEVFQINS